MPRSTIRLELEPGEPIAGTLHDAEGTSESFRGWLELCAALDRVWQRGRATAGEKELGPDHAPG